MKVDKEESKRLGVTVMRTPKPKTELREDSKKKKSHRDVDVLKTEETNDFLREE